MGDHRAHIKIELSMYGRTKTADFSINWPVGNGQCDERIAAWFARETEQMYYDYWCVDAAKWEREREERDERAAYERLKAKFEGKS
jgi:hypothetical protein